MVAIGSAWATILTTMTVSMDRVVSPVSAGCWNNEMDSATMVGTVQSGTAMTVEGKWEMPMVQVVERKEDAGEAGYIEFRVYQKPTDPAVILGEMSFVESESGAASITTSNLGALVEGEYLKTLDYANQRRIPFVWINDPGGLFPASKRAAPEARGDRA
jgi:hypothetical protein